MNATDIENERANTRLTMLPEALLAHVLQWLPFSDRRRYFSCCHDSWRNGRRDYEALLQSLVLTRLPPSTLLNNLNNLHTLDIGSNATNDFLRNLQSERVLPKLKHLFMAKSMRITDEGLDSLTRNSLRCQTLESIDISYCRNTTYAGTFVLRDKLKALQLLRRQPQWMDGRYETPFENDHLHTYWPDGTFSFSRETLNSGYVCDYFLWNANNEHCVGDKLQYNDLNTFDALPQEVRNSYRPGVSLVRLPGNDKAILVAQLLRGLYPPKDYPKLEHEGRVELGHSVYLDVDGNVLANDADDEDLRHVMISHIPRRPLESLMPPRDIVEKNRVTVANLDGLNERMWIHEELALHMRLRGRIQDFEAIRPYYE